MASVFDTLFDQLAEPILATQFGEAVEYTFRDGHSVTDTKAFVDFIESGYEVDAGIRTSQDEREGNERGITYQNRKTFGLRKSVIGEAKPEIYARVRVVSEGDNADVWTVWRVIGSESARWYVECERTEIHERSAKNMRSRT